MGVDITDRHLNPLISVYPERSVEIIRSPDQQKCAFITLANLLINLKFIAANLVVASRGAYTDDYIIIRTNDREY